MLQVGQEAGSRTQATVAAVKLRTAKHAKLCPLQDDFVLISYWRTTRASFPSPTLLASRSEEEPFLRRTHPRDWAFLKGVYGDYIGITSFRIAKNQGGSPYIKGFSI